MLFHYNPPYGDIHMEVAPAFRRRGLGTFLTDSQQTDLPERVNAFGQLRLLGIPMPVFGVVVMPMALASVIVMPFGLEPVITVNRFADDVDAEIAVVERAAKSWGVPFAEMNGFAEGGEGAEALARTLVKHVESGPKPEIRFLYEESDPLKTKIEKIATTAYGAAGVVYTGKAEETLKMIEGMGYGHLPVCMAKTPASLSDDPALTGRPQGFQVTVRDFVISAGAGFVVALLGDVLRMPGLSVSPQAHRIDLVDGQVVNLR